jgi:hypothetical protein
MNLIPLSKTSKWYGNVFYFFYFNTIHSNFYLFQRSQKARHELRSFQLSDYQLTPDSSLPEWKRFVQDLQKQFIYQEDQLMNLEIAETTQSKHYLQYNNALEKSQQFFIDSIKEQKKSIHSLQKERKEIQENFLKQLTKHLKQKDMSLQRLLSCQYSFQQLKEILSAKGFDYEEYVQQEELDKKRKANVHDPEFNSTVREYQTINETRSGKEEEEEKEEQKEEKKEEEQSDRMQEDESQNRKKKKRKT